MREARRRAALESHCRTRDMQDLLAVVAIKTELDENAAYRAMRHNGVSFVHFKALASVTKPSILAEEAPPAYGATGLSDYCRTNWAARLPRLPWEEPRLVRSP